MDLKKSFSNTTKAVSGYFSDIDVPLFAGTLFLALVGLVNIAGIVGFDSPLFQKQLAFVGLGLLAMTISSFFNYRYLKNSSIPVLFFYVGVLALLIITLLSPPVRGIRAWISLGSFTFEPSELAKIVMVVLLAKYFSQRHIHINQFRHIIMSGLYTAIPAGIIFIQPDLGSAVIVGLLWFAILMAAGINRKHFFLLVAVALIGLYVGWSFVLRPYQKDRLVSFINPYKDPTGIGYNIIQSKIAIGSGLVWGNGLGGGSQATLGFLPEPHNDFAFAAFVEQFGFAGCLVLLAGLGFLLSRIFFIGQRSPNNFGKLFALGLGIIIGAHTIISAAVNTGLMPITGIPFTFLSYGGSHIISVMLGIGILQSIKRYG